MTLEEVKLRRLSGQHLLQKQDTQTVVKDLCGVQSQFLSHALHALSLRCDTVSTDGLLKSWTNRGTMHLFSAEDLPLFLHAGKTISSARWTLWNRTPILPKSEKPISPP